MAYIIFILFILYYFSHAEWFNIFSILTSGDWYYQGPLSLTTVGIQSFNMWSQNMGFGGVSIDIGMRIPLLLLSWITTYFDVSYALGQRIVWFFPMILFSLGGSYLLFRHIFQSKVAVFAACLLYNFNVYFSILQLSGHMGIALGYAIMPFCIYFAIRFCEKTSLRNLILATLSLFFLSLYEPRIAYIGLGLFIIIGLCYRIKIQSYFSIIVLFVLFSAFSFFPVLFGGIYENNEITSQQVFGDQFMTLSNSLALFHTFWNGIKPVIFSINPIPFFFWIVPIMALLGYMLHKKSSYVYLFGIFSMLGIFLTKQGDYPFPEFYQWAYDHIPLFNLFRESSKFYIILILGYAGLVGFFIDTLFSRKKWKILYFSMGTLLIYTFINVYPLITKEVGTMFVARSIPEDYQILNEYIKSDKMFSRVAMIPFNSRWFDYSLNHPAISVLPTQNKTQNYFFSLSENFDIPRVASPSDNLEEAIVSGNIGYMVIAPEDRETDNFYSYNNLDRKSFLNIYEGLPYLKKLELGTEELIVYKVDDDLIGKRITGSGIFKLVSQRLNPSEYRVNITLNGISDFHFLESFHMGWNLYIEPYANIVCVDIHTKGNISECDTSSVFYTPDSIERIFKIPHAKLSHKKIYNFANSWTINPDLIRSQYPKEYYKENPDGSIDIQLTLYFLPQSYFYIGLIISGCTLFLSLGYLIYVSRKKTGKAKHKSL